jgi:two-component system sensor histidine kinase UhpB
MRLVEIIASPLWGPTGEFDGIIESMRDVTERERSAKALEEYAGRLRALSARMAQVSEGERGRLARELHDRVGENLTALGINLSIVRSQMPAEALAAVDSRLADSLALVESTTERIRDVMADLRPPVLDDYGLAAALRWYGEQFARRTGLAIQMDAREPEARAEPHIELALFRIAQEALTNVAKHARATRVHIELLEFAGAHRLVIADDGVGFDPLHAGTPSGTGGWGLLTMAERAEAVGGRWSTVSAPGEGTRIIVEVPG